DQGTALGAHDDLVLGLFEIAHVDGAAIAPGGKQCGFVDQVGEVGTREARRAARQDERIDIGRKRHLAHMHLENLLATANIGQGHHHLAVEATRTQKRRIKYIRTVGGGNDQDALAGFKTVHFDQQLVERLLAFVVTTAKTGAALTSYGVDLVNEDNAGSLLLGVFEHVANACSTHPDKHLDEVGARDAEEGNLGFAGDCLGQQRLARSGRTNQQYASRNAAAKPLELGGIAKKIDQFGDVFFGFVAARHIGEGDVIGVFVHHAGA